MAQKKGGRERERYRREESPMSNVKCFCGETREREGGGGESNQADPRTENETSAMTPDPRVWRRSRSLPPFSRDSLCRSMCGRVCVWGESESRCARKDTHALKRHTRKGRETPCARTYLHTFINLSTFIHPSEGRKRRGSTIIRRKRPTKQNKTGRKEGKNTTSKRLWGGGAF